MCLLEKLAKTKLAASSEGHQGSRSGYPSAICRTAGRRPNSLASFLCGSERLLEEEITSSQRPVTFHLVGINTLCEPELVFALLQPADSHFYVLLLLDAKLSCVLDLDIQPSAFFNFLPHFSPSSLKNKSFKTFPPGGCNLKNNIPHSQDLELTLNFIVFCKESGNNSPAGNF